MRIKRITVGKGLTINLGDWNSLKPSVSFEAELDDGDDPEMVREHLKQMVDEHLDAEIKQHTDEN